MDWQWNACFLVKVCFYIIEWSFQNRCLSLQVFSPLDFNIYNVFQVAFFARKKRWAKGWYILRSELNCYGFHLNYILVEVSVLFITTQHVKQISVEVLSNFCGNFFFQLSGSGVDKSIKKFQLIAVVIKHNSVYLENIFIKNGKYVKKNYFSYVLKLF